MLENPVLSLSNQKEIERMGDSCEKMLDILSELRQKISASMLSSKLRQYEMSLDTIQEEIASFMTKLFGCLAN